MNNFRRAISILCLFSFLIISCKGGKTKEETMQSTGNDSILADVEEPVSNILTKSGDFEGIADIPVVASYYMKGDIDKKYEFTMSFSVDSNRVSGSYTYKGKKENISIGGTIKGSKVKIEEQIYKDGKYTTDGAYFDGIFDYVKGRITGTWHSSDGTRSLPFSIDNYYGTGYPQFAFKVYLKKEISESGYVSLEVNELHVYDQNNNLKNILGDFKAYPLESVYNIFQEDFNFDGYPDIAMMEHIPSYPPNKFLFWLYNPDTKQYEPTDMLDDIYTLPEINHEDSTTTITIWHNQIHHQTYKFNGSKWIFKDSSSENIGDE